MYGTIYHRTIIGIPSNNQKAIGPKNKLKRKSIIPGLPLLSASVTHSIKKRRGPKTKEYPARESVGSGLPLSVVNIDQLSLKNIFITANERSKTT
tara:strand:- start:194 stop:478 length:285 start_codon:yes stop_codon:yes gene_type:complete